jgi:hypothetical protein
MTANTNLLSSTLKMLPCYCFHKEMNSLVEESFLSYVLSVVHFHTILLLMTLQPAFSPGHFQGIFHSLLSNTLCLHPLTLSILRSPTVPFIHLSFGLPTLLHPRGLWRMRFLIGLSSNIWVTWPAYLNLSIFMVLIIFGSENSLYNFYVYILYARIFTYYMQRKK